MNSRTVCLLSIFLLFTALYPAVAGWSEDPTENNPVCLEDGAQLGPRIISDDAGGAIITWWDDRDWVSNEYDIYIQRIDSQGDIRWLPEGVPVCVGANWQVAPEIIPDGGNGAIIVWQDRRVHPDSMDVYAQRISGSGVALWTPNGIPVCTASNPPASTLIISDGSGGAIIAWEDYRNGTDYDIYAQRIDSDGSILWWPDGVLVCGVLGNQDDLAIAADGAGGAVLAWKDFRGASRDIYAQRIEGTTGHHLWTDNGILVCGAVSDQSRPDLVCDATGVFITWDDERTWDNINIYAQKFDLTGTALWAEVMVTGAFDSQRYPHMASDGVGGAVITWQDYRGDDTDIYAQRIDSTGLIRWMADGVVVCDADRNQSDMKIAADHQGGAVITWQDARLQYPSEFDVYAQRFDSSGNTLWDINGLLVSGAVAGQLIPQLITDPTGGALITWYDFRGGVSDIYAQYITSTGTLGNPSAVPELGFGVINLKGDPNPFTYSTRFEFYLTKPEPVHLQIYSLSGRLISTLVNREISAGFHQVIWDGCDMRRESLPGGVYFTRLKVGTTVKQIKTVLIR